MSPLFQPGWRREVGTACGGGGGSAAGSAGGATSAGAVREERFEKKGIPIRYSKVDAWCGKAGIGVGSSDMVRLEDQEKLESVPTGGEAGWRLTSKSRNRP